MALTPDEEETLRRLQQKQTEASITTTDAEGNVRSLFAIPGGKQADPENIARLRAFVKKVESGEIQQFISVGLRPDGVNIDITYSHAKPTFGMIGALETARAFFVRAILG